MLKKNRLLAITAAMIAMESDVENGKLFRERERVIYARLTDLNELSNATSVDSQEQWQIKLPKTENNAAKGTIRVRKVMPLMITDAGIMHRKPTDDSTQYVITVKTERKADDRLEVPLPASEDMFNLFKLLAENGMHKHRFHFPIEGTELVFEVDAFPKVDGVGYHDWVKIDLELKDITVDIPELPFKTLELIYDNTQDPEQKKKISELYDTIFLKKNPSLS
jgi:hypothetical protein